MIHAITRDAKQFAALRECMHCSKPKKMAPGGQQGNSQGFDSHLQLPLQFGAIPLYSLPRRTTANHSKLFDSNAGHIQCCPYLVLYVLLGWESIFGKHKC